MPEIALKSPAQVAAEEAQQKVHDCIDRKKSFLLEAGAGAGKTYSLIAALKYLIKSKGAHYIRQKQQVACITYTIVAVEEIKSRTEQSPIVLASTLHSFFWSLIKDFQPLLKEIVPTLSKWADRLTDSGGLDSRRIEYDLGYPSVHSDYISLAHDDILPLAIELLKYEKFRALLKSRYPVIFIDEYQDTNGEMAKAIKNYFLENEGGPLIGFFGDHWQKIYGQGCGLIEHSNLEVIKKGANFRSAKSIVDSLNRIRPELTQAVSDPDSNGSVQIFHSNNWNGLRRSGERGGHWDGDLPEAAARDYFLKIKSLLTENGWDFSSTKSKILMLTHSALAREQGYSNLAKVFPYNDSYVKKEDHYISFFVDALEPACIAYEGKRYGEMFSALGRRTPNISSYKSKLSWAQDMDKLISIRATGTIGEVLEHIKETGRPRITEAVERKEREYIQWLSSPSEEKATSFERIQKMREIPYSEVISIARFVNEKTPFATKHGVKGAEFENVLVVIGRGWNQYNFNQFLELAITPGAISSANRDTYERNRNLFYVVCSRPKKQLAILFTQELSTKALETLSNWFGVSNVRPMPA